MALELQPPTQLDPKNEQRVVFLAGSIEQGKAKNWQAEVIDSLADLNCVFLNPRRSDWNSDLLQAEANKLFREQVEWELDGLESADVVVFFFDHDTQSPVTLLELGLLARSGKLIVCCPEGFWRKGNVDIVCRRYSVETVASLQSLISALREKITA